VTEGSYWAAPEEGHVKANVDAGWDEVIKIAGIGIIIRDHLGQPVLSEWRFVPNYVSAEEAEMMACLGGIKHIVDIQRGPAIVESD
jgi:hypothetical protein